MIDEIRKICTDRLDALEVLINNGGYYSMGMLMGEEKAYKKMLEEINKLEALEYGKED